MDTVTTLTVPTEAEEEDTATTLTGTTEEEALTLTQGMVTRRILMVV